MAAFRPKKKLGQHFLTNRGAVEAIIAAALASPAPALLEIGPGRGALTAPLLKDGRPLWAIEIDADAYGLLAAKFCHFPNFHLLQGDALAIGLPGPASAPIPSGPADPGNPHDPSPAGAAELEFANFMGRHGRSSDVGCFSIVGNLPYNAATAILTKLLLGGLAPWERMVLMFQQEVAQKLTGRPGEKDGKNYGPLSVLARTVADIITVAELGPGSFRPPPKVRSAVLQLTPKPGAPMPKERRALLSLLHAAFAHRRKTLANNLRAVYSAEQLEEACRRAGTDPGKRAEDLGPEAWLKMLGDF